MMLSDTRVEKKRGGKGRKKREKRKKEKKWCIHPTFNPIVVQWANPHNKTPA